MIYYLIPIYNEEKNIQDLFSHFSSIIHKENSFFVFSDDGSRDKSKELLTLYFKDYSNIVLGDGINYGPGHAFNKGFEWICNHSQSDDDTIVTMEADCTSDITLMPKLIAIHKLGFNLVLASVYAQGGNLYKTNFFRKFISISANTMFKLVFDVRVLTLSSFYRVYSVDLIRSIKKRYQVIISETGFICMLEILLKAIKCNAEIIEVPTTLKSDNRKGKSKMKIFKTMVQYLNFFVKFKFV